MKTHILYIALGAMSLSACSDYLDLKPDAKMAVPKTLEHADLILNDYNSLNTNYPTLGEVAVDDYYLTDATWGGIAEEDERATYNWNAERILKTTQWQNPYKAVYLANQALKIIGDLDKSKEPTKYARVQGGAHFFRAFAFHQVVRNFTMPYNRATASQEMGIPLRLDPGVDYKSVRATLADSYAQIISDYEQAIALLPRVETAIGRPSKAAAYAGLARLYLDMQDYAKAYANAEESLKIYDELILYESLNAGAGFPFVRFNKEVLFPAITMIAGPLGQNNARIDPELYAMYAENDLRKALYFKPHPSDASAMVFKGSYNNNAGQVFVGLTTSEVYLIKAEAGARIGKLNEARQTINGLLRNRIAGEAYIPISENNADKLLRLIVDERRKELVFRGSRWADLKRLNQDEQFKKTLTRTVYDKTYTLEPNSLKYAHLLPELVIEESGMAQNKR